MKSDVIFYKNKKIKNNNKLRFLVYLSHILEDLETVRA